MPRKAGKITCKPHSPAPVLSCWHFMNDFHRVQSLARNSQVSRQGPVPTSLLTSLIVSMSWLHSASSRKEPDLLGPLLLPPTRLL